VSPPDLRSLSTDGDTPEPEQLVTDPAFEEDLRLAELKGRRRLEAKGADLAELVEAYESLLADPPSSTEEREQASDRLAGIKQRYARTKREREAIAERFATVLVLQALRETGDGVPDPAAAEDPIRERLAESELDDRRIEEYLRAVREELDFGVPDPLAWIPEAEIPDHAPPDGPVPGRDDPTWELPPPERTTDPFDIVLGELGDDSDATGRDDSA
jgi:hypothetical protein